MLGCLFFTMTRNYYTHTISDSTRAEMERLIINNGFITCAINRINEAVLREIRSEKYHFSLLFCIRNTKNIGFIWILVTREKEISKL